jgi:hypothetical protein
MKLPILCSQAASGSRLCKEREPCGNTQQPPQAAHQTQTGLAQGGGNRRTRAGLLFFGSRAGTSSPVKGLLTKPPKAKPPLKDPFSHILAPLVQRVLNSDPDTDTDGADPDSESESSHTEELHEHRDYVCEMWYIYVTHTLAR